jgi:hypothetical protein
MAPTPEHERLATAGAADGPVTDLGPWALWGPYVAERAWGTVREDYSASGDAWSTFPHDHARSRAYRWNEDGMAGICDLQQRLCLALSLWNGRDPILKERMFGLSGPEGNHGEDAKEYWWYLDALPSHALLRWRYHYPQQAFPYEDLLAVNARRSRHEHEYELLDTGIFDQGYWIVEVTYAKASPTETLMRITVRNAGPERDRVDVLPTLWFRNTWRPQPGSVVPGLSLDGASIRAEHPTLGTYVLEADGSPAPLFCDNETNTVKLYGSEPVSAFPKDGINDHVLHGRPTVAPDQRGTKAAFWFQAEVDPGETVEFRLRLRDASGSRPRSVAWAGASFDSTMETRQREADDFYATLTPTDASRDEELVLRQAFAGLIWSKQYYAYDVRRWLEGDPGQPAPPSERLGGRNVRWQHMDVADILAMPDPWEYPWFAAWDLAFHAVVLAHVDPTFAKYQLLALTREWYMHPNGALPAYEWTFDDVNPPVHAWAAIMVYVLDGARDREFLVQIFHKLMLNFTWWVNRVDAEGSNLFEGGFLGLDNISPFDRSNMPVDGVLEQSDGTAWMAGYCLAMLSIALELSRADRAYNGVVTKFAEHFATIVQAMNKEGLWDAEDAFFYDRLRSPDGEEHVLRYRSLVGVIPLLAVHTAEPLEETIEVFNQRFAAYTERTRGFRVGLPEVAELRQDADGLRILLSLAKADKLTAVLREVLDEDAFLSPYGLRSLSKRHQADPFVIRVDGMTASVDYQPAESTTAMFGGNSNWRGPVWFPMNVTVLESLERFHRFLGDDYRVECPTGSGQWLTLREVADELRRRLISIFLPGPDGRRPCYGGTERFHTDPEWRDLIMFHEYFHGDDGAGLGASHQTGWTALVAHLIVWRRLVAEGLISRGRLPQSRAA